MLEQNIWLQEDTSATYKLSKFNLSQLEPVDDTGSTYNNPTTANSQHENVMLQGFQ